VLDNGVAQLNWQTDGNLVLVQGETVLFETHTSAVDLGTNNGREFCFFIQTGIEILNSESMSVYSSLTEAEAQTLTLDESCNLLITDSGGAMLWQAGVSCIAP